MDRKRRNINKSTTSAAGSSLDFVLVSVMPTAFENFETPFGEFNSIKRQGEQMLLKEYPSLSSTVLQMAFYEDNFVGGRFTNPILYWRWWSSYNRK